MKKLMVTRFNNETWRENQRWREKNNFNGCIYNSPVYIKEDIPLMITIYVIEMNNDTNQIIGIGRLLNKVHTDKKYKIYEDQNYNRFTYRGKQRIDKDEIDSIELEKIEKRLFKSKKHLKRGQGITRVTQDVTDIYLTFIDKLF
jgi:hypothetical protein